MVVALRGSPKPSGSSAVYQRRRFLRDFILDTSSSTPDRFVYLLSETVSRFQFRKLSQNTIASHTSNKVPVPPSGRASNRIRSNSQAREGGEPSLRCGEREALTLITCSTHSIDPLKEGSVSTNTGINREFSNRAWAYPLTLRSSNIERFFAK